MHRAGRGVGCERFSAASAGGCSEGGLEAIAEFIVSPDSPEELQSAHEIGTAIRFVQDGDRVVVHAGSPRLRRPPAPTASAYEALRECR